jgi:hypothetical protein
VSKTPKPKQSVKKAAVAALRQFKQAPSLLPAAARQVGDSGRVIGVDMTSEMVSKARDNAEKGGYRNVEFRLGEIESLPLADNAVDVIISNCVINLSPDKPRRGSQTGKLTRRSNRRATARRE